MKSSDVEMLQLVEPHKKGGTVKGKLLSDGVKHKYWLFEHTDTILN